MVKKKRFPCGHVGHGQWCHRCAQVDDMEKELQKLDAKKQGKQIETLSAEIAHLKEIPLTRWKQAPREVLYGAKKR